jgi:hypothetical protein
MAGSFEYTRRAPGVQRFLASRRCSICLRPIVLGSNCRSEATTWASRKEGTPVGRDGRAIASRGGLTERPAAVVLSGRFPGLASRMFRSLATEQGEAAEPDHRCEEEQGYSHPHLRR